MSLREQIMNECENYKANFHYVNDLYGRENDYDEAKDGGYDFMSCPQYYICLKNAEELCSTDNEYSHNTIEECRQCWKNALAE